MRLEAEPATAEREERFLPPGVVELVIDGAPGLEPNDDALAALGPHEPTSNLRRARMFPPACRRAAHLKKGQGGLSIAAGSAGGEASTSDRRSPAWTFW